MGDLVLAGGTSGTITVTPTAVAGSNTLTLPAATGTILTTASSGQIIPKAALPTGSVLQVVQANYSTNTTNATSTYADTGLTASITPTSSSSKILVIVAHEGVLKTASDTKINIKLLRGATDLTVLANAGATNSTTTILIGSATFLYLDSPATTSNTTYKTQFNSTSNTSYVAVQDSGVPSTITLMEIAA